MNTLSSLTRPDDQDRLVTLSELTRDTRVSALDRLSLRFGLWLLLRAERRTHTRSARERRALQVLARDERTRLERENSLVRAAVTMQYR